MNDNIDINYCERIQDIIDSIKKNEKIYDEISKDIDLIELNNKFNKVKIESIEKQNAALQKQTTALEKILDTAKNIMVILQKHNIDISNI